MRFQVWKYKKYLKSKNNIKKRLSAFNQELWVILNFKFGNFRAMSPCENGSKKLLMEKANLLMEKASQARRNVVKNFIVMRALNTTLRILYT